MGSALNQQLQGYSAKENGTGGVNYFSNGNAITNTQYGQATGQDYGALEKEAATNFSTKQSSFAPYQKAIDALNSSASTAAPTPNLIYRDTNAAWQSAQNTAATSVNPVYTDYLNNFITNQKNLLGQTTAETSAQKTAADTILGQTQEDIATNRARTAQDTATLLATNKANEGNWQTTEGATNTVAEDAARTAAGDQGIMGRGAGQLGEAKIARNQASDQQTQAYKQERDTTNLLQTRTFADLETKGARAVSANKVDKTNLDRQLSDFIVNQGTAAKEFKSTNEQGRLNALSSATQNQYQTDLGAWLADLANNGASGQDLALTKSVYA